tara:strand:+ start:310 stop:1257 length:948 start_codon:yes stop_codon:yes gene_type:complete
MEKAVIIGGGSWGLALALAVSRKIGKSFILTSSEKRSQEINNNNNYSLANIFAGTFSETILKDASLIIIATEVRRVFSFSDAINKYSPQNSKVLIASKGFYKKGEVLPIAFKSKINNRLVGVLSGPSFAEEVIKDKPTALVVAGQKDLTSLTVKFLHTKNFRIYGSNDVVGTSVSGAMKNVIAIASGIVFGLELGENARAAMLTRGLAETVKLVKALGGKVETVFGLAGAGDMALSALSPTSRNFSWGYSLAKNEIPKNNLVEGIDASKSAVLNAKKYNIEMPITQLVEKACSTRIDLSIEIEKLLQRPPKFEWK